MAPIVQGGVRDRVVKRLLEFWLEEPVLLASDCQMPHRQQAKFKYLDQEQTQEPGAFHVEYFGLVNAVLATGRLSNHDLEDWDKQYSTSEGPLQD